MIKVEYRGGLGYTVPRYTVFLDIRFFFCTANQSEVPSDVDFWINGSHVANRTGQIDVYSNATVAQISQRLHNSLSVRETHKSSPWSFSCCICGFIKQPSSVDLGQWSKARVDSDRAADDTRSRCDKGESAKPIRWILSAVFAGCVTRIPRAQCRFSWI